MTCYGDGQRELQQQFQTRRRADLLEQVIVHPEVQEEERAFRLLASYPGADLVVRVAVSQVFVNCSRYVHQYRRVKASRYVPRSGCETPFAERKRIDVVQEVLPPRDEGKAARVGGTITVEQYEAKLATGEA